ncbi:MAG: hypothetical protein ACI845_000310 [Gammaproteobacteria bacterium]
MKSFYDRIRGAGSSYLNRAVTQFVLHPQLNLSANSARE